MPPNGVSLLFNAATEEKHLSLNPKTKHGVMIRNHYCHSLQSQDRLKRCWNRSRHPQILGSDCCCCSVAQLCLTLCDSMDCRMSGFYRSPIPGTRAPWKCDSKPAAGNTKMNVSIVQSQRVRKHQNNKCMSKRPKNHIKELPIAKAGAIQTRE